MAVLDIGLLTSLFSALRSSKSPVAASNQLKFNDMIRRTDLSRDLDS